MQEDCHKVWTFLTLADRPRVERVVKTEASDVRVSPDPLDLGHLADLRHLEEHGNTKI